MKVGDMVALNLKKVYLGFVVDLGANNVVIHFLDGDRGTRGTYYLDELEWEVISESR
jgi:hypothetical protein